MEKSLLKESLSKLCAIPFALQNRALFEREKRAKKCREKREGRGVARKGGKKETRTRENRSVEDGFRGQASGTPARRHKIFEATSGRQGSIWLSPSPLAMGSWLRRLKRGGLVLLRRTATVSQGPACLSSPCSDIEPYMQSQWDGRSIIDLAAQCEINPRVRKIFVRNSGAGMGASILWTPGKMRSICRKNPCPQNSSF